MNKFLKVAISIGVLIVSTSVGYYFFWALPNQNREKNGIEMRLKQQELESNKQEEERKQVESVNNIKQGCLSEAQKSYSALVMSELSASPNFFPYFNELSFERNTDLIVGVHAYEECIKDYPGFIDNTKLKDVDTQAKIAESFISLFVAYAKQRVPSICESKGLSSRAMTWCLNSQYNYDVKLEDYLVLAVDYGMYKNKEDGKKELEDKFNSYKDSN
jgi:hypothetical protein